MEDKIRVGLVGCGNAGSRIHLPLLRKHQDLYRVVACADLVPEKAVETASEFGIDKAVSVEDLLHDEEVELVIVATRPPRTHRDIACAALKENKHVVVEKPMAGTVQECDEMIEAAGKKRKVLAVHHNRRWDVDFLTVREIISSGAVGEVRLVRNEFTAGYNGCCYDWAIHLLDQTMALSQGKKFVEVTATFCRPKQQGGFFTARFRTEDDIIHDVGMLPPVQGSGLRPGKAPFRFLVAGTEGIAYLDWCQRPEDAFVKFVSYQSAFTDKSFGDLVCVQGALTGQDFYRMLFSCLRQGEKVPVSGEEGRRAVYAWELLTQSALQSRCLSIEL